MLLNGVLLDTASNNNNSPNTVNWQQYAVKFTPTIMSNTITFRNATPNGDNMAGLDDVYLDVAQEAVPEPATMVLMGGSLLAIGFAKYRRRRS